MEATSSTSGGTDIDLLDKIICQEIKGLDEKGKTKIFESSVSKFKSLSSSYSRTLKDETPTPSIQDLTHKIRVFAFHYLSRTSTLPLPKQDSWERGQRSPFDYVPNHVENSYYRGDGSALASFVLTQYLPKSLYSQSNNAYRCGLIKPDCFPNLMEKVSQANGYKYVNVDTWEKFPSVDSTKGNHFFDISNWIRTEKKEISECLKDIQEQANKLPNHVIGGVFRNCNSSKIGIYIFFTLNDSANLDCEKSFPTIVGDFLDIQGNTGGFPEMIEMKSALKNINGVDPLEWGSSECDSVASYESEVIEWDIESSTKSPLKIYLTIIKNIYESFSKDLKKLFPSTDSWIQNSINTLQQALIDFQTTSEFYEQLQCVYRMTEEIIFLSEFYTLKINLLKDAIPNLFDPLLQDKITGNVFTLDSGMACFAAIIDSAYPCYFDSSQPNRRPVLGIVEGAYYEIKNQEQYSQFLNKQWEINVTSTSPNETVKPDLLILDLYPNDVNLEKMRANPVQDIIEKVIHNRKEIESPLTVVIDVSTALFSDPQISELKNYFNEQIDSDRLNLIIMSSLAKFYGCGLDKYTGGAIVILGGATSAFKDKEKEETFRDKLKGQVSQNTMSHTAQRFYSLLFQHAHEEIQAFYDQIINNTQSMHLKLEKNESKNFNIRPKDTKIPMIGIYSESKNPKNIEQVLADRANKLALPLLVRASFPFPHSAITECDLSLRLIIGLESQIGYLNLFKDASNLSEEGKEEEENS